VVVSIDGLSGEWMVWRAPSIFSFPSHNLFCNAEQIFFKVLSLVFLQSSHNLLPFNPVLISFYTQNVADAAKKPAAPKEARPATAPAAVAAAVVGETGKPSQGAARNVKKPNRDEQRKKRDDAVAAGSGATRVKREKDRRTTAGPGGKQSKDGAGAAGWGSEKGEAQKAEKDPSSAEVPIEDVDEADPESTPEEPEEPAVPEPATFTLEQYMAKKKADDDKLRSLVGEAKSVRKVTQDFAGLKTANNVLENLLVLGTSSKKDTTAVDANKSQRSQDKNVVKDILNYKFVPDPQVMADREDRGDRGGGRGAGRGAGRGDRDGGRGGRGGGGRGERSNGDRSSPRRDTPRGGNGSLNLNDTSAFPSL